MFNLLRKKSFTKLFKSNILDCRIFNASKYATENSRNSEINPIYVNRNPRNLDWGGYQYKRFGWNLHYPPKDFYHQCVFKKSKDCLEAYVEHQSGEIIIYVSTDDPALKQYLHDKKDLNASIILAKHLAAKCDRFGINNMNLFKSENYNESKKEQMFYEVLAKTGIILEEPSFKERTNEVPGLNYDEKDFYNEKLDLPFPPTVNKIKRENLQKLLEKQNN